MNDVNKIREICQCWNGQASVDSGVRDGFVAADGIVESGARRQRGAADGLHRQILLVGNRLLHNAGHHARSRWLLHLLGLPGLGPRFLHLFVLLRRGAVAHHERLHGADRRVDG